MKPRMSILVLALLLAACSLTPVASRVPGYLTTPKGRLLQDAEGHCWRTAEWRPTLAIPECDPEVVLAREEALAAVEKPDEEKEEDKEKGEDVATEGAATEEAVADGALAEAAPGEEALADDAAGDAALAQGMARDAAAAADDGGAIVAGVAPADAVATAPAAATGSAAIPGAGAPGAARAAAVAALAESLGTRPAPAPRFRDEVIFEPVTLNSDASFYFGDDHLTEEGRAAVMEIAGILKARRATDLRITVTGHTDRVGAAAANLALSRRRAQAVKAALVEAGLPAAAIETAGLGAARPVTVREQCPDRLVKCELITCLKPDRRVEIQARGRLPSGTRQVPVQGQRAGPRPLPRTAVAPAAPAICSAG